MITFLLFLDFPAFLTAFLSFSLATRLTLVFYYNGRAVFVEAGCGIFGFLDFISARNATIWAFLTREVSGLVERSRNFGSGVERFIGKIFKNGFILARLCDIIKARTKVRKF